MGTPATKASKAKRALLDSFFEQGLIRIQRGPIFDHNLEPMPDCFNFDRVEGMLLGLAIGDALGRVSEGLQPALRQARFGEIRNYLPARHAGGQAVGLPTDDTQLAFWSLEQMLREDEFDPEKLAELYASRQIYGIGGSVAAFVRNYRRGDQPWFRCGPQSAGNGALMRIAPMLVPHLRRGGTDLWVDTALSAMLTHNDSASIAACLAFVAMLWQLLQASQVPPDGWWMESYLSAAEPLECDFTYSPRTTHLASFQGSLSQFVLQFVPFAYEQGLSVRQACDRWYSAAYLLETVPSVLYILMRHAGDAEHAIVRTVNDTKDNDTVGAIVGAAVGALHGAQALPTRWREGLLGRTQAADNGQVQRLIQQARKQFWDTVDEP